MGKVIIKIVYLVFFIASFADARIYSLDELLIKAVTNSKTLRSIQTEMQKAESQVQEAMGSAMPSVSASINVSHSIPYSLYSNPDMEKVQTKLNTILNDPSSGDIALNNQDFASILVLKSALYSAEMMKTLDNAASLSLSLNQPIYAQGKVSIGLKIAKEYQRTLVCKHNQAKGNLRAAVTILYYKALLAQKSALISQEAVTLSERTHHLALITHAVGKASELDTLSSLLYLENARIDQQKSECDKRIAYDSIITFTGLIENANDFSVEGDFPEIDFTIPLDTVLQKVKLNNPQIEQLKGRAEIYNQLVSLAKTDFYPFIFAGGSIGEIGMFENFRDFSKASWGLDRKLFVGLNWDIFTGLRRNQKLTQAKADHEIFLFSARDVLDGIELQTRTAYEQLILSRDRLTATRKVITLADKGYTIAQKSYEVGSKTLLDVQNAEFQLNSARIRVVIALFVYNCALVNIQHLMNEF